MGSAGVRDGARRFAALALAVVLWTAALACLATALLRVAGVDVGYPLTVLIAVTPYVGAAALLVGVVAFVARRRAPALLALAAFGLVAVAVVPRQVSGSSDVAGMEVRVLSLNLEFGRADPRAVIDLIERERPDVVSLQEIDAPAAEALERGGIDELLAHSERNVSAGAGGTAIWSTHPLEPLPGVAPAILDEPQARALIRLPGGARLDTTAVHVRPPVHASWTPRWIDGLAALPPASRQPTTFSLLAGDFNATLDHAQLRDVIDRGYVDAADADGAGLAPTWPVGSVYPPVTIDHLLVSERAGVSGYGTASVDGTDHRAVFATLTLPDTGAGD
ncbi:endonuclease/exonuclease/phosphatase family protein [Thermoleophilia bacterium SCSIO 60948]|nr:endonuclease/exonuclease/phosphatase family protein [Thermoleophilia bacterium SCSIO 60948]